MKRGALVFLALGFLLVPNSLADQAAVRIPPVSTVQVSSLAILRENAPAVEIHRILPAGDRLSFVRVREEDGSFVRADASILAPVQSYSLVIRETADGVKVLRGAGIRRGDVFVRGVIHSLVDADVWIFFESGRTIILPQGENLLLGDESIIEGTHTQECRCTCEIRRSEHCQVILSEVSGREAHNGEACLCSNDPGAREGNLKDCHVVWVPLQVAE